MATLGFGAESRWDMDSSLAGYPAVTLGAAWQPWAVAHNAVGIDGNPSGIRLMMFMMFQSQRDSVPKPGVGRRPTLGVAEPMNHNPNRGCVRLDFDLPRTSPWENRRTQKKRPGDEPGRLI